MVLRVGHLRNSEYELQQHRRLARSRGVDNALQQKIFAGPDVEGLTGRQRAMLTAVDEFILTRDLSDQTSATLASTAPDQAADDRVLCALAGNYDAIAAILAALRVPMDFPD